MGAGAGRGKGVDRRTFLRATLVTAGGLVVGAGCDDDQSSGGGGDTGVDADTGGDVLDVTADGDVGPEVLDGSAYFPQSIASGDPRADSVILWARVEDAQQSGDLELALEVARDEAFAERITLDGGARLGITAESGYDHCVKVKVQGLDAGTDYYYRFLYGVGDALYASRTGRARTAPANDDDRPVRFAFCSCNDYNGRYFNAFEWMARQELDFFVHLGDYIYETTGNPQFQDTHPDRAMVFTDEAGAIVFNEGTEEEYFAAKSLSNYRDLEYGPHVHLFMTDLRTYRPDHLVPEDALPGAIAMTQGELELAVGDVPEFALPYVDIDAFEDGAYAEILSDNAGALGFDEAKITGNITVAFINDALAALNTAGGSFTPISEETAATLPRGMAYSHMFKVRPYGQLGSRYFVIDDTFRLYAGWRYAQTGGASEDILGQEQELWFLEGMGASTKTWKIWGNEFCLVQKVVDLRSIASLPAAFRQRIRLSAEDWDGAPNKKNELIGKLADIGNVVAVTGDIHAFFAATPFVSADPTKKIVELVGGAISSGTYQQLLARTAASDPALAAAGAEALALIADEFLRSPSARPNRDMAYADIKRHGFGLIEAGPSELVCELHHIAQELASQDLTAEQNLGDRFEILRFRVLEGSPELYREVQGAWRRWDMERFAFVEEPPPLTPKGTRHAARRGPSRRTRKRTGRASSSRCRGCSGPHRRRPRRGGRSPGAGRRTRTWRPPRGAARRRPEGARRRTRGRRAAASRGRR
jgi:phosphodiesterase/alkaline phosphatase D-like protein